MLALLRLLPVGAQIGVAVAILVAGGGGYYAWRSGVFNKGVAYEHARQKERDDEAVGEASEGRLDVRTCYNAGRVWDAKVGICH
jgi:hypothetical protein